MCDNVFVARGPSEDALKQIRLRGLFACVVLVACVQCGTPAGLHRGPTRRPPSDAAPPRQRSLQVPTAVPSACFTVLAFSHVCALIVW